MTNDLSVNNTPTAATAQTTAAAVQSAAEDDSSLQSFALLLSGILQAKATSMLTGSSSDSGGLLSGMDGSLVPLLLSALSENGDSTSGISSLLDNLAGAFFGESETASGTVTQFSKVSDAYSKASQAADTLVSYFQARSSGSSTGTGDAVPADAWVAVSPGIRGSAGNRSAALLDAVIDQFDVENSSRYTPHKYGSDTYCNIFVWDVTNALGVEIPHYIDAQTGEPRYYPDVTGAMELDANGVCSWLESSGAEYGWREVTAEAAQYYANQGYPAVTALKNSAGAGHVQVVRPSRDGGYDSARGVTVAQSGGSNREYAYITSTLSAGSLKNIKYYVHA